MPFLSDFINQAPTYRRGLLSNLRGFAQDTQSQQQVGQGLLDAANRGLVAQTLGAPVDIANSLTNLLYAGAGYAGNKLGLLNADQMPQIPDPRTVVGSSEWWGNKLQQGGFVSENRNPTAETLAGLLAPAAYKGATKVGQGLFKIEQNMLANAAKPSTMTMQGQRGAIDMGNNLRVVDVFGNGKQINHYDDAKGLMYQSQSLPSGTKWTVFEARPPEAGGDQVLGQMMKYSSLDEAMQAVKGLRVSDSLKALNSKYSQIPSTWNGDARKVAKALIDAGVGIDKFANSSQTSSKYLYLTNGDKVRLADHSLPLSYDSADHEYRYGQDINELIGRILK